MCELLPFILFPAPRLVLHFGLFCVCICVCVRESGLVGLLLGRGREVIRLSFTHMGSLTGKAHSFDLLLIR